MEQYISKSALVAELENLLDKGKYYEEYDCAYRDGRNGVLYELQGKIDTLKVKEVDLEKAWKEFLKDGDVGFKEIAKHFFELGMQFQTDTNITLKYNIGESVREYKAQKGEEV